jgi:16S rRNA (guanine527-N7)-methyltransferase
MLAAELSSALRDGAAELECPLTDAQADALLAYVALILKWNRVYNLTAVRDPAQMLTQHLLDSLSVVPPLRRYLGDRAVRLLDVGSGAGLPGIVLALMLPSLDITCVDAVAKKAGFMRQAAAELGLPNVHVQHARVEGVDAALFELITSRAFSSLADLVRLTRRLAVVDAVWLAMKGKLPADEIAALPDDVQVFHVEPLRIPGLQSQRCLVWMRIDARGPQKAEQ